MQLVSQKISVPRWSFDKLSRMHISFQTGGYGFFYPVFVFIRVWKIFTKVEVFFLFFFFLDKPKKRCITKSKTCISTRESFYPLFIKILKNSILRKEKFFLNWILFVFAFSFHGVYIYIYLVTYATSRIRGYPQNLMVSR